MIDRCDAHLVRIGSLQNDRRPVSEDLRDAFYRFLNPQPYPVELDRELALLKEQMIAEARP